MNSTPRVPVHYAIDHNQHHSVILRHRPASARGITQPAVTAAQRLLYEVELRPGEIAEADGYPDICQFSKQFKKRFGVSPTQYRKLQESNLGTETRSKSRTEKMRREEIRP